MAAEIGGNGCGPEAVAKVCAEQAAVCAQAAGWRSGESKRITEGYTSLRLMSE